MGNIAINDKNPILVLPETSKQLDIHVSFWTIATSQKKGKSYLLICSLNRKIKITKENNENRKLQKYCTVEILVALEKCVGECVTFHFRQPSWT